MLQVACIGVLQGDARHASRRWAFPQALEHVRDRILRSADQRTHRTVRLVAYPAGETESAGFVPHPHAKAHALHAALDLHQNGFRSPAHALAFCG